MASVTVLPQERPVRVGLTQDSSNRYLLSTLHQALS